MKIQYTVVMLAALVVALSVQATVSVQAADKTPARKAGKSAAKKTAEIAAQNASAEIRPAELIALLQSDAPKSEKVKAFKPLAVFGGKDAVPAIAPYLADEELSSWARIALEAIPDPSCDETLRKAEADLKGRLLVGVINSIGVRRDAKAVDSLIKRLADVDADVAVAAAACSDASAAMRRPRPWKSRWLRRRLSSAARLPTRSSAARKRIWPQGERRKPFVCTNW